MYQGDEVKGWILGLLLMTMSLLGGEGNASLSWRAAMLGYDGEGWKILLYEGESGKSHPLTTEEEPHGFDYDFRRERAIYSDAMGRVHLLEEGRERILPLPKTDGYIQPSFDCSGERVYLVELPGHSSRAARIVAVDLKTGAKEIAVEQTSAQLEPVGADGGRSLIYTSLSCNRGCGGLLQEIWRMDTVHGRSEQLTLLNAFSSNPAVHAGDPRVYFSSNRGGHYHIWSLLPGKRCGEKELTRGEATDAFPAPLGRGDFLFLRSDAQGDRLMWGGRSGRSEALPLDPAYRQLRQLKVDRCTP
jgi:hypothetical protein